MSDRRPKVTVTPVAVGPGAWFASCCELGCPWTYGPDIGRTYVEQRARAHRANHRKARPSVAKKSDESQAHDRETFKRLLGLGRAVKKTAPPPDPKKGGKKK